MHSASVSSPNVTFRPVALDGRHTGVLDISLSDRRVLSAPSQLGCSVGCTFCVSGNSTSARNLSCDQLLQLVDACFGAQPADGRPVELSFTGEGEPVLNWKSCARACASVRERHPSVQSVRYCFSGLGAPRLLGMLDGGGLPMRLQFSLHAARQVVRDTLVPRSSPLHEVRLALLQHQSRFTGVDLNVVLQHGVNDSDEDLQALVRWVAPGWRVVFNPLLTPARAQPAPRLAQFLAALEAANIACRAYEQVGQRIARQRIYPLLASR